MSDAAAGGESYRGQFAEMRHCHHPRRSIVTLSGTWHHGPCCPLLTLLRLYSAPHKCTVLSGCPGPDAHQTPGCWMRRWICPRTHQYLSPGPGGETLRRSQSILQRKLRISQDTCAGLANRLSPVLPAHNKLLLCLEIFLCT